MHRALVVLLALGVGACDLSPWPRSPGPSGDLAPPAGSGRSSSSGGGYASGGGVPLPSERILYGNTNPYHGGYSCNYQSSSGPVRGVRAYDRNRCCIDTPSGRSCQ
jgi:hypothetical protein